MERTSDKPPDSAAAQPVLEEDQALLLYDGVCGLCDRVVQFVLARDDDDRFRFAPLQGPTAGTVLARHGIAAGDLDTFHLVVGVGRSTERVYSQGSGAIEVLRRLGRPWSVFGALLYVLPSFVVDAGYRVVARTRYRVFGKADQCVLPSPQQRSRFFE